MLNLGPSLPGVAIPAGTLPLLAMPAGLAAAPPPAPTLPAGADAADLPILPPVAAEAAPAPRPLAGGFAEALAATVPPGPAPDVTSLGTIAAAPDQPRPEPLPPAPPLHTRPWAVSLVPELANLPAAEPPATPALRPGSNPSQPPAAPLPAAPVADPAGPNPASPWPWRVPDAATRTPPQQSLAAAAEPQLVTPVIAPAMIEAPADAPPHRKALPLVQPGDLLQPSASAPARPRGWQASLPAVPPLAATASPASQPLPADALASPIMAPAVQPPPQKAPDFIAAELVNAAPTLVIPPLPAATEARHGSTNEEDTPVLPEVAAAPAPPPPVQAEPPAPEAHLPAMAPVRVLPGRIAWLRAGSALPAAPVGSPAVSVAKAEAALVPQPAPALPLAKPLAAGRTPPPVDPLPMGPAPPIMPSVPAPSPLPPPPQQPFMASPVPARESVPPPAAPLPPAAAPDLRQAAAAIPQMPAPATPPAALAAAPQRPARRVAAEPGPGELPAAIMPAPPSAPPHLAPLAPPAAPPAVATHPAATPLPDQNFAVSSDRLGAVRIEVSGSSDALAVTLTAAPAAAPILAGEAPRLAQDLAAAGVALASYAVNGQRADVAPETGGAMLSGSGNSAGHGQPQPHQQAQLPQEHPRTAVRSPAAPAPVRAPLSTPDRFA